MRLALILLLGLVTILSGCNSSQERSIIPSEIPPGTVFKPIAEVTDFGVTPKLRILRDPESPSDGIAAVIIDIVSRDAKTRKSVQAAVWLPEGVSYFTPMSIIGTNRRRWHVDLTPEQPGMGIMTRFRFKDYTTLGAVKEAFMGPTRVKVEWDGGQSFFEFPSEKWEVEVVDELPATPDGK